MKINDQKIGEILIKGNYITKEDLAKADSFVKSRRGSASEYLLSEGLISKDLMGQAIAEDFGVPYFDLNTKDIPQEQILLVPEELAKKYRVILFDKTKSSFATDDPKQTGMAEELKAALKLKKVTIGFSLPEDIDQTFIFYHKSLDTRFGQIVKTEKKIASEIFQETINYAILNRASDVHFEPQEKDVVVRFRVDGVLQDMGRLEKIYYDNVLNRVKVFGRLRIDEHAAAQDGAIRYPSDPPIDLRVSITPTMDGEKIVIRVLGEYVRGFSLLDIGLSEKNQKLIEDAAKKPFGMILVSGPTGSGKTTTLYSLLKMLNRPEVNITTIEDPVEYKIPGLNQIQVNPQTNLTFAKGLRSIVRQDPDIILVGEIRDRETAEISVNAALTGHLLLSTFHANDAATSVPRLLDMGVEPFLLSSTLEIIIAQRLARRICDSCRYSMIVKRKKLEEMLPSIAEYFEEEELTLYEGKGCKVCNETGFKGRVAIFEIIKTTPQLRELILQNPSAQQVWTLAKTQGSKSLFEDGIEKVKNGQTTLEEILRVSPPPSV